MVRYSSRAAAALAFLKRPYNDVDIFVEDTSNPNMWLYVARKLLPQGTFISSVSAVGGWRDVVNACRQDQIGSSRRRLYIIDGDMRLLQNRRAPRLKHLYQLSSYCIENLIAQEQAIIKCASISKPADSEQNLARRFAFSQFLNAQAHSLLSLFVMYAVCNKIDGSITTIGLGIEGIYENTSDGPSICRIKTLKRLRQLRNRVLDETSIVKYRETRSRIARHIARLGLDRAVSGKHYILPILHKRFAKLFGQKHSYEQWKVQLASYWDGAGDRGLARRLANL